MCVWVWVWVCAFGACARACVRGIRAHECVCVRACVCVCVRTLARVCVYGREQSKKRAKKRTDLQHEKGELETTKARQQELGQSDSEARAKEDFRAVGFSDTCFT